ncbi:amidohydrolase [Polynucleobacter sp. MWH-UH35A]|uniref:amidohydrolase n=1 Tax=Polynucleobacter sp. MWH-UH35A TaxID=1855619 RepID=UPI001BFE955F|nr:amidohydrolase family protein [Polynucleobacter sp. MWH-UH35A]QWD59550.1 amidohydrolase family protein [Polynucleobacter sp. MWH-UH35A]
MKTLKNIFTASFFLIATQVFADTTSVYFNGDILTMEGDKPQYVEAVVVKGKKIAYAGNMKDALSGAGANAVMNDLKGQTLLPGFIDAWGHFTLIAQNTLSVNLGYFSSKPPHTTKELISRLKNEARPFNGWIIGSEYADAFLSDGPLTIAQLDAAFPDQPVYVNNISTLTGIVNTAGLKKLGFSKATKVTQGMLPVDPKTGKLTGELIGDPNLEATAKVFGKYSHDLTMETYRKAEKIYASNGYTTAQSYETTIQDIANMRQAVDRNVISLDLIALPTNDVVDQLLVTNKDYPFGIYTKGDGGFKVAGILVSTDGAPQLRLAYFTKPYAVTTGFPKDWRGMAVATQGLVDKYAKLAYEKNIQYFGYSNGDAGIDMTLSGIAKAVQATGVTEDRRTVISHSFFVRDDQLDQYKANKILPQFMPNHIWMYGDVYKQILGDERASNMVPLNLTKAKGMQFGLHNDTPSSGPSALFTIWTAVNRKTYGGSTLGSDQRIDPYTALRGFTSVTAYQYKEEALKGSITAGKLADMVQLDRNPLKVDPMEIKDIQVVKTIKNGKDIFVLQ